MLVFQWKLRKNYQRKRKSRLRIARLYERITNQRLDFLHKLSNKLIKNFQLIAFEKLNIKGMAKNKYLAKSIVDASWFCFLQQLRYKAAEAGIWVIEVNPKNTTQVCSGCGNIVPKTMVTRIHNCSKCGLKTDRDINAARNILQLALNPHTNDFGVGVNTVGTTGINACGVEGMLPTKKQEAIVLTDGSSLR